MDAAQQVLNSTAAVKRQQALTGMKTTIPNPIPRFSDAGMNTTIGTIGNWSFPFHNSNFDTSWSTIWSLTTLFITDDLLDWFYIVEFAVGVIYLFCLLIFWLNVLRVRAIDWAKKSWQRSEPHWLSTVTKSEQESGDGKDDLEKGEKFQQENEF
ncbi:hypothetical protein H2200_007945 [Cladophialophora chaetospira]|uniref:Uncharacterized protein n=1 Tax=Cladophialophora chaetospira TaxID=386627 RepID=A0AA38X6T9_9EURO|nr:hypothetical protein H2200_007945 [Cladophialophora chaetospira]